MTAKIIVAVLLAIPSTASGFVAQTWNVRIEVMFQPTPQGVGEPRDAQQEDHVPEPGVEEVHGNELAWYRKVAGAPRVGRENPSTPETRSWENLMGGRFRWPGADRDRARQNRSEMLALETVTEAS